MGRRTVPFHHTISQDIVNCVRKAEAKGSLKCRRRRTRMTSQSIPRSQRKVRSLKDLENREERRRIRVPRRREALEAPLTEMVVEAIPKEKKEVLAQVQVRKRRTSILLV